MVLPKPVEANSAALGVRTQGVFLLAPIRYARLEGLVKRWVERMRMITIISTWAFVLCFVLALWPTSGTLIPLAWPMILAGLFLTFLIFGADMVTLALQIMLGAFVWIVIALLSILLLVPFGWQAAVANFLLDIAVDATPVGSWETHLVASPSSEELGLSVPLLHHYGL